MPRIPLIPAVFALLLPGVSQAQGAGDWTGASVGGQFGFLGADTAGTAAGDGDGGSFGARAFYDFDFGGYILGGGLGWDRADIDLGRGSASLDDVFRLGARAGVDAGSNWYYGTLGWARASVDDPANAIGASDGYYFGLGYEVLLAPRTTVGAELLHHEFDDFDMRGLDLDTTTLNVSVNFRF